MGRTRSKALVLLLVGAACAFAAIWLALDSPTVDSTSAGDSSSCLAPYDTVLNGASNVAGGEPRPGAAKIAATCREAGRDRFRLAVIAGSAGAVLLVVGTAAAARSRRPSRGSNA